MSWRESNAPRLRNGLCVLLLSIFAGSTVAQSSNKDIAPSGLEWEKRANDTRAKRWSIYNREVDDRYEVDCDPKIPTWPRDEIYEFKFEIRRSRVYQNEAET